MSSSLEATALGAKGIQETLLVIASTFLIPRVRHTIPTEHTGLERENYEPKRANLGRS
jgi:hypothetical protein